MKKIALGLATATLTLMAGNAFADGMPTRYGNAGCCVFSWTGFYVGVNAGWAQMDANVGGALNPLEPTTTAAEKADVNSALTHDLKDSSFIGGAQVGYNWQVGTIVFGLEADIARLRAKDSAAVNPFIVGGVPAPGNNSFQSAETTFLATVRPRVGMAFDHILVYVTGGLAVGNVKYSDSVTFAGLGVPQTASIDKTKTGWTLGGGVEFAFGHHWTAKAEYLHVDLGNDASTIPASPGFVNSDVRFNHSTTEEIVRFGLNYKFGGDCCAAPLK